MKSWFNNNAILSMHLMSNCLSAKVLQFFNVTVTILMDRLLHSKFIITGELHRWYLPSSQWPCVMCQSDSNKCFSLATLSKKVLDFTFSKFYTCITLVQIWATLAKFMGQYCNDEKSFKWNSDKMFHNCTG